MSNHSSTSLKEAVADEKPQELGYRTGVTEEVDRPGEEALKSRILRKIDLRLLPILGLMYCFNLIDRSNLGLIRVAGMGQALSLSVGNRYSIATLIFFIPTSLLELPATIYARKTGAGAFISACVFLWGCLTLSAAFVKNWHQLVALRFLLGILDASFFPAAAYLITLWYVRREVQFRLALFWQTSMCLSGFSPILAYGLAQLNGKSGLAGWQWIWLVEGIITAGLGLIAYPLIVNFPEKNKFLTAEETQWVHDRIQRDRGDADVDELTWGKLSQFVGEWRVWAWAFRFTATCTPGNALAFFLPTILLSLGYSVEKAEIMTAPPFIVAAVYSIGISWVADRVNKRAPFLIWHCILVLIGLPMTAFVENPHARYAGVFIALMGAAANVPGILAWQANNVVGQSKKAFSTAITISFAGPGGILGAATFRQADAPKYIPGFITCMLTQGLAIAIVLVVTAYHWKRNKDTRAGKSVIENTPGFFYTL